MPRKIGHRLTLALAFLIAGVLLIGGFSLYQATAITQSTNRLKAITQRIEHTDHIHLLIHHLAAQLNRAIVLEDRELAGNIEEVVEALEDHLRHYVELAAEKPLQARPDYSTLRSAEQELAAFVGLVRKAAASVVQARRPSREDLDRIRSLEDKLRDEFFRWNSLHQSDASGELQASRKRMNLIAGIYLAFLVIGSLGLLGWNWAVSRTIVFPIRSLASAALELARGDLNKRVPVTSEDEIGQLARSFNFMAERLKEHEEKLKGFAALEERERIAQELHDSLAQDLALIHLKIREAEQGLTTKSAQSVRETLKEMREISDGAFDNVRQAIFGLRTMVSKSLGFIPTLTEYLHDFSAQSKIPVDLKVGSESPLVFGAHAEVQLIRIIHEALTNVLKHANATRSEVRFEREGVFTKVTIEDNGKGFSLSMAAGDGLHFGLKTMRERARAVGGDLRVDTEPGKGTKVIVYLPLEEKDHGNDPGSSG